MTLNTLEEPCNTMRKLLRIDPRIAMPAISSQPLLSPGGVPRTAEDRTDPTPTSHLGFPAPSAQIGKEKAGPLQFAKQNDPIRPPPTMRDGHGRAIY